MMSSHNRLPKALPDRPFPVGDIEHNPLADEWIATMEGGEWDELMSYADATHVPERSEGYYVDVAYKIAKQWCSDWDAAHGADVNYAEYGHMIANAFVRETNLLPVCQADFRAGIINKHNLTDAAVFAQFAWRGMAFSHPRVFAYHEQLYDYAEKELDLVLDDNAQYFIAGLSLPYLMSLGAALAKDARDTEYTVEHFSLAQAPRTDDKSTEL